MNYTLTDDDYNDLDSINGQLGFVNSLLQGKPEGHLEIDPVELSEFLAQLHGTTRKLIATLDERQEAARQHGGPTFVDWLHIIQALSGRTVFPRKRLQEIAGILKNRIGAQPEMASVYDAWMEAIDAHPSAPS